MRPTAKWACQNQKFRIIILTINDPSLRDRSDTKTIIFESDLDVDQDRSTARLNKPASVFLIQEHLHDRQQRPPLSQGSRCEKQSVPPAFPPEKPYPNTKALYALVLAALAVAAFGFYSLLAIFQDPLL
jgi:hypothetical protein